MEIEIKEKILRELRKLFKNNQLEHKEQDEFFWYFTNNAQTNCSEYRVFKFFANHQNKMYTFEVQQNNMDSLSWDSLEQVAVERERLDDRDGDYWRDPEPIRPFSLQGLRIRLHQAFGLTSNIHESFYLISNEVYQTTLDTVAWFEDKQEEKHHENILAYNMLKLFQAFDVFKEDINNDNSLIIKVISETSGEKVTSQ